MDYRTQLIALAEAYREATGRSESRVSTIILNQSGYFARIRAGQSCTVDTYLKVKDWFASNWPAEVSWPDGVDRPSVPPRAAGDEAAA